MRTKIIAATGIVAGIVAVVLFFLWEDLGGMMIFANGNSPVFIGLAALSAGALVYVKWKWKG